MLGWLVVDVLVLARWGCHCTPSSREDAIISTPSIRLGSRRADGRRRASLFVWKNAPVFVAC